FLQARNPPDAGFPQPPPSTAIPRAKSRPKLNTPLPSRHSRRGSVARNTHRLNSFSQLLPCSCSGDAQGRGQSCTSCVAPDVAWGSGEAMRVLMSGATGFIGRALCRHLVGKDDEVWVLSRRPAQALASLEGIGRAFTWDAASYEPAAEAFE